MWMRNCKQKWLWGFCHKAEWLWKPSEEDGNVLKVTGEKFQGSWAKTVWF